jgi:putative membrane protein
MFRLFLRLAVGAIGLWIAARLIPGVSVSDPKVLILAAILLGLANALIRPIAVVLTLPITFVTLGLFLLVVNGAMIGLVAWLLDGFTVTGFVPALLAAVVTGIVSWAGQLLIGRDEADRG